MLELQITKSFKNNKVKREHGLFILEKIHQREHYEGELYNEY